MLQMGEKRTGNHDIDGSWGVGDQALVGGEVHVIMTQMGAKVQVIMALTGCKVQVIMSQMGAKV